MGVSYRAYTVIGCKYDVSDFIKTVKSYDHTYSEDMLYDPKTGKKLWKEVNTLTDMNFPTGIDCVYSDYEKYDRYIGLVLAKVSEYGDGAKFNSTDLADDIDRAKT